jgi:pyridinium-3,5-biscarboxylic acid mononucleotide sulfurtransferase
METIEIKLQNLRSLLNDSDGAVIGYSGGCDSTLLAAVAKEELGNRALCVLLSFEAFPESEKDDALKTADALGLSVITVREKMLEDADFVANTVDRCYFCKKVMFGRLSAIGRHNSIAFIADGSNTDDLNDDRPGMRAASELGVKSPLLEAGFTKNDIRKLSRLMKLPTWNKPSFSCLASRIPYGTRIEQKLLKRIETAEQLLKEMGFHQVRVRHHGDIARIEVKGNEIQRLAAAGIRRSVESGLQQLGYHYVTLDLHGYETGSMNKKDFR